ncbi:MAG: hypothetical protein H2069_04695 [Legionella sp.]|nr:hypothetical protein [Legionella sp.]
MGSAAIQGFIAEAFSIMQIIVENLTELQLIKNQIQSDSTSYQKSPQNLNEAKTILENLSVLSADLTESQKQLERLQETLNVLKDQNDFSQSELRGASLMQKDQLTDDSECLDKKIAQNLNQIKAKVNATIEQTKKIECAAPKGTTYNDSEIFSNFHAAIASEGLDKEGFLQDKAVITDETQPFISTAWSPITLHLSPVTSYEEEENELQIASPQTIQSVVNDSTDDQENFFENRGLVNPTFENNREQNFSMEEKGSIQKVAPQSAVPYKEEIGDAIENGLISLKNMQLQGTQYQDSLDELIKFFEIVLNNLDKPFQFGQSLMKLDEEDLAKVVSCGFLADAMNSIMFKVLFINLLDAASWNNKDLEDFWRFLDKIFVSSRGTNEIYQNAQEVYAHVIEASLQDLYSHLSQWIHSETKQEVFKERRLALLRLARPLLSPKDHLTFSNKYPCAPWEEVRAFSNIFKKYVKAAVIPIGELKNVLNQEADVARTNLRNFWGYSGNQKQILLGLKDELRYDKNSLEKLATNLIDGGYNNGGFLQSFFEKLHADHTICADTNYPKMLKATIKHCEKICLFIKESPNFTKQKKWEMTGTLQTLEKKLETYAHALAKPIASEKKIINSTKSHTFFTSKPPQEKRRGDLKALQVFDETVRKNPDPKGINHYSKDKKNPLSVKKLKVQNQDGVIVNSGKIENRSNRIVELR